MAKKKKVKEKYPGEYGKPLTPKSIADAVAKGDLVAKVDEKTAAKAVTKKPEKIDLSEDDKEAQLLSIQAEVALVRSLIGVVDQRITALVTAIDKSKSVRGI